MKIFIDPGHGGTDPGAVNNTLNIQEADVNLQVALKLGNELQRLGHTIRYSRSSNTFVTLSNRAQMANEWGADYFIAVHCNSSSNTSANGTETLCYRLNTPAAWLATSVQRSLVAANGLRDRGVKAQNVAVLRLTRMPAILVELGFLSNTTEARKLTNNTFQQDCADGIALGIQSYLTNNR